jgi:leucine dehydrogenase
MLAARDILYAPDYVINAGGIIDVSLEYLGRRAGTPNSAAQVNTMIEQIPARLRAIWNEAESSGLSSDAVADKMAQKLIGRG